jgi:hypothetical protein
MLVKVENIKNPIPIRIQELVLMVILSEVLMKPFPAIDTATSGVGQLEM